MSATDRALLLQLFGEEKARDYPKANDSDYFELFVAYHYLKQNDLDYSDIEQSVVDGAGDGGVDAVITLIDGRPVSEVDLTTVRKNPNLSLNVFSTKFIDSFKTGIIADLRTTLNDLLNLDDAIFSKQAPNYNIDLIDAVDAFRQAYTQVASKLPKLTIKIVYATACSSAAKPEVSTRLDALRADLLDQFSDADVIVEAADAKSVLARVREASEQVRPLQVSAHSINLPKGPSYICLSSLSQFYEFVKRPEGGIEQRLFEDNVRDWEGDVQVNRDISKTLDQPGEADFWWLNNGVSIICDSATLSGNTLQIKNPKIVNGLQTSRQIYSHFSGLPLYGPDDRMLLVRVISAEDENIRADIIRATNRQTPILPAQLLATSSIHKDIELYLRGKGVFYERRKNHWKNLGKKRPEIVSVIDLAQAMISLISGRPHVARARPGSLLKTEADDKLIFDPDYDLAIFEKAIDTVRSIEAQIADEIPDSGLRDRNNIKYQVAAKVVYDSCGKVFGAQRFLSSVLIQPAERSKIIAKAFDIYVEEGGTDAVAKSEEFWLKVKAI